MENQETYRPDRNMVIPHQNFVNLYFRKAFLETHTKHGVVSGEVYERHLLALKTRFKTWDWRDQWYWDLLFAVNERGQDLTTALQKTMKETIDPERENWIRNQIHNPEANFQGSYFFYGGTKP
jgi:hypothetical protein